MNGHKVILRDPDKRAFACRLIQAAPADAEVTIRPPRRTIPQNDRMWEMLTRVSVAKPDGRKHIPGVWKCLFMNAAGYPVQFETGLSGEPFPLGFHSSRLSVKQMGELMDFIEAWAAERGFDVWGDAA